MIQPKCPYCDATVHSVSIHKVTGNVLMGSAWNCVAYSCQACHKVLSIQMDPIALKHDTVQAIKKG